MLAMRLLKAALGDVNPVADADFEPTLSGQSTSPVKSERHLTRAAAFLLLYVCRN
ncbi:hypothetical protein [Stieleria marina]|uniref:Uncharacterized protein n=1 Tax=Stieleria marina TaxID=1930275 RepID=A0A517NVV9_9BACT|nr:hypothetical protein K239x_32200 [Planctomycetes bacterium K23_9]